MHPVTATAIRSGTHLPVDASVPGHVWINPYLVSKLASGEQTLVALGPERLALMHAGWVEPVTDLHVQATPGFLAAHRDAGVGRVA